jgi:hypothetical protein
LVRSTTLSLVIAASALTACGEDPAASSGERPAFDGNRQLYALPLDRFGPIDVGVSAYAGNLLVKPCMEKSGYDWPIPAFDSTAAPGATWNSVGRRLFDPDIAAQYGYHIAPSNQPDDAGAAELNSRPLSPPEKKALDACFRSSQKQLPPPETELISSLGGAAYDAAKADGETLDSAERWRECMKPSGISDLPAVPSEMPSPSIARRFKLGSSGSTASPQEIQLAVADARCRESSGYAKHLYAVELDKQLDLISSNRDALDRVKAANARHHKKARSIIARYDG